jgi:hypothetical protein
MIPFERDVYIAMLKDKQAKKEEAARQQAAIQKAMAQRGY